jgi:hypothetical protein
VDGLGEERGRVAGVFTHRLGDGHHADAKPLAEKLLVAACLDLVASEARRVVDEHHVELAIGSVGHEPLKLGAGLGLAPTGVKVAVLADQLNVFSGAKRRMPSRCASGEKPWPCSSVGSRT